MNRIQKAFDTVKADEQLKENTAAFIHDAIAPKKRRPKWRYMAAAMAVLLVAFFGVGLFSVYQKPVSFISIDVNPSLELQLNRFDTVIDAVAYNDEMQDILQNLKLTNKHYTKAVELLLEDPAFSAYLTQDAALTFTVVSDHDTQLTTGLQNCRGYQKYNGECSAADTELMQQAHENGMSFGKYKAYLALKAYEPDLTVDECKAMSMRQIKDKIAQYSGGTQNSGNGGGSVETPASIGAGQGEKKTKRQHQNRQKNA